MIHTSAKRCEYQGCDKYPSFGIEGGKGLYCVSHKNNEMIDIKSKHCEYKGCISLPVFNVKGSARRFCVLHKTDDMIDVVSKRCEHEGCDKLSSFGVKGGKKRFCLSHKASDMINIKKKECIHDGCDKNVAYGIPGHQKSHCFKHRNAGMIRRPTAKCRDCKNIATWGINWTPHHCETHKMEDDENLVERPCVSCGLMYVLDKHNKCEICNPESWTTVRLAKQTALMDFLDARDLKGSSTDKMVDNGVCGKERPDRVYDFGDKVVILECDEHQHQERACLCEQTRMINIGQSFGGTPVYFIRWNPDDYSSDNSRKLPEPLSKRHKLCCDLINDIKFGKIKLPSALLSVIYLYYDGWNSMSEEKWQVITSFI